MDVKKYIAWCSSLIVICMGVFTILLHIDITTLENKLSSSPVEEMCHKQVVADLDSILNIKVDANCCEKGVNDNYNVSISK